MEEETNRIISASLEDNENTFDVTLRPKVLDEFVGQSQIKENLNIFIEAAR